MMGTRTYDSSLSGVWRHCALPRVVFTHPWNSARVSFVGAWTTCSKGESAYAVLRTISVVNGFQNVGQATPAEMEFRIAVHSGGVLPVIADVSTMRRPTRASTLTKVVPLATALTSTTRGERVDQGEQDDERDENDCPHGPPTDDHGEPEDPSGLLRRCP